VQDQPWEDVEGERENVVLRSSIGKTMPKSSCP